MRRVGMGTKPKKTTEQELEDLRTENARLKEELSEAKQLKGKNVQLKKEE